MEKHGEPVKRQPVLMGTLLRIPYSAMGDAVERSLRAAGYGEIRRSHLNVLQPLFTCPDGAHLTDLAAWAHITKPSIAYLVQHLETHGYVTRTTDPTDGRAQQVQITLRGIAAVQLVRSTVLEMEAAWAAQIGPEHLEHLRQLLRELAQALQADGVELW